jgi:hypothetical protein
VARDALAETEFRPGEGSRSQRGLARRQALALLVLLLAGAGAIALLSYVIHPSRARAFSLFYGSVYLDDERAPVVVDLTNGKPTVRLVDAAAQVSATDAADVATVPLSSGTLLVDTRTGEFNLIDQSGFVVKKTGGGVALAGRGATLAVPAGTGAYLIPLAGRPAGATLPVGTLYLVDADTVQSAANGAARINARARATMADPLIDVPNPAVGADHDLWLLVRTAGGGALRQFPLPQGSPDGVVLAPVDHGSFTGPAALGTATAADGHTVVGLATRSGVEVYRDSKLVAARKVAGLTDTTEVLAASNATGRLYFLFHRPDGWSVLSIGTDGAGLAGPVALPGLAGQPDLAAPAYSGGDLYTVDRTTDRTWQISASAATPIPGAAQYPLARSSTGRLQEPTLLNGTQVIGSGPRVVINSGDHTRALTVFTDGSHPPVVINKGDAVAVSTGGGAAAIAAQHLIGTPSGRSTKSPTVAPVAAPIPVNNSVDCKTARQQPHVPQVNQVTPGSDQVSIAWSYPVLDPRDCLPSTYLISIALVTADAPTPLGQVTVQGSQAVVVSHLFPGTQYRMTVSAVINGLSTPSAPFLVTTGARGPDAPLLVQTRLNADGSWHVAWQTCGGRRQGCVPASVWTISAQLCDQFGGLVSLNQLSRIGDETQTRFAVDYPAIAGGGTLLGRSLAFSVTGIGGDSRPGGTATGGCVRSWAPPLATAIHVASAVTPNATGTAQDAAVSLSFDGDQTADLGGFGAELSYQLLHDGQVVATQGPTSATRVTFPASVQPGLQYQAEVTVIPPVNPAAAVTLPVVDLTPAVAAWPALSLNASSADDTATVGTLTVGVDGVNSAASNGETFGLTNDSSLTCGNAVLPLRRDGIGMPAVLRFDSIQRTVYNGDCTVTIGLVEDGSAPLYFGGQPSPTTASASFHIDAPVYQPTSSDFTAAWLSQRAPAVSVSTNNSLAQQFGDNWQFQLSDGGNPDCGTVTGQAPPVAIPVSDACKSALSDSTTTWTVSISFTFFGQPRATSAEVSGTAPQPIDPTRISFTGQWGSSTDNGQNPIQITYQGTYDNSVLSSLTWSERVTSSASPDVTCASATTTPDANTPFTIDVDPATCPTTPPPGSDTPPTFTVTISYDDPNYSTTHDYTITVGGTPPTN